MTIACSRSRLTSSASPIRGQSASSGCSSASSISARMAVMRAAQVVRGVGGEAALPLNGRLQPVQRLVGGLGQPPDLVVCLGTGTRRPEVGGGDLGQLASPIASTGARALLTVRR